MDKLTKIALPKDGGASGKDGAGGPADGGKQPLFRQLASAVGQLDNKDPLVSQVDALVAKIKKKKATRTEKEERKPL